MQDILMNLAQLAPVVAVLVVAVMYFLRKEDGYKKEISSLNVELRKNERESLELISRLTTTLDKLMDSDSNNKIELLSELRVLKESILNKIDNLKK